jgi:hypothetical protein
MGLHIAVSGHAQLSVWECYFFVAYALLTYGYRQDLAFPLERAKGSQFSCRRGLPLDWGSNCIL